MRRSAVLIFSSVIVLLTSLASQNSPSGPQSGIYPFATLFSGPYESVNLANLNIMVHVPVRDKNGSADMPFSYSLNGNSVVYSYDNGHGQLFWSINFALTDARPGNLLQLLNYSNPTTTCSNGTQTTLLNQWWFADSTGAPHYFPQSLQIDTQGCIASSASAAAGDGSGYTLALNSNAGNPKWTLYDKSGRYMTNTLNGHSPMAQLITSPNGNRISESTLNGTETYTDSLGVTALKKIGTANGPTYNWTDANGNNQPITVNQISYTFATNFKCPQVNDGSYASGGPSSVSFPDGSNMSFSYEATTGGYTGRLASITLPTGGKISYAYSGGTNGINCQDGTPNTLKRTTPDSATPWTYIHTPPSVPGGVISTTQVIDPSNNETDYTFSGQYEVQRIVKDNAGHVLKTVITCYNGNTNVSTCPTTWLTLPITEIDAYTTLAGMSTSSLTKTFYDAYGNITQVNQYDFGSNTPTTQIVTPRGSWVNGTGCTQISSTIQDRLCYRNVYDGANPPNLKFSETFSYDGAGNLTTHVVGTTTAGISGATLTTGYAYYANGSLHTSADVDGTVTTYTQGACNGLLPTSISVAGLTSNLTWDCLGGVKLSETDANSPANTTSFSYATNLVFNTVDPFWRVSTTTDPLGNITSFGYGPNATYPTSNYSVSSLAFGSSNVYNQTYQDSLGRPLNIQRLNLGTAMDTVTASYDGNGRLKSLSMPCSSTANVNCPASPATTTSYDGLGRPLVTTDGGGGTVTYCYGGLGFAGCPTSGKDVLVTVGPAPSGENAKKKVYEYNGLGQLAGVCEITSASGSGACGQTGYTGYWTAYAYNTLGHLTNVTQGSQTRTFSFDALGRLLSEANPESGTTNYVYDTTGASSCSNGYTSKGDLVRKYDAVGNNSCFYYDGLHRLTDVGIASPVASFCKRFRYDNSTGILGSIPAGITVANPMGHMVEAETDTCAVPLTQATIYTDEWFSYNGRGELTDLYESTPHSSGYYHSSASYYPNGALQSLNPRISGLTLPWNYNVDSEGRMILDQNTTYNAASQLTKIVSNTGDNDVYTYDSNTGRMTQYQSNIGTGPTTVTGVPQWNPNGTLQKLTITDGFTASASQTCLYGYDDLARLGSVNCTNTSSQNVWNQNFTYDAYGNITKTVPTNGTGITWNPGYTANNQYASGSGAQYDADGNLLNDTFNTYTWNVDGAITITPQPSGTTTTITYDALGREVEFGSSTFTQVMYAPTGKIALMNGQTGLKAFQPLPGGSVLVHRPAAGQTNYWRHPDWLGSSRLATTTPGRTKFFDTAYAPFGENYLSSGTTDLVFTGKDQDTATNSGGLYDFLYREYAPRQGRWISPDPAGTGAADPGNPRTWNRYAYLSNNPLSAVDPLGLWYGPCESGAANNGNGCEPPIEPNGGWQDLALEGLPFNSTWGTNLLCGALGLCGSGDHAPNPTVHPKYARTFGCNTNAAGIMSKVEGDFSRFGNFDGTFGPMDLARAQVNFGRGPVTPGGIISIHDLNTVGNPADGPPPFGQVIGTSVTVTSVSATSFSFTTNPGHVLYPATITFSATDAGKDAINFSIQVSGEFASLSARALYRVAGNDLENKIWNNFIDNVAGACTGD